MQEINIEYLDTKATLTPKTYMYESEGKSVHHVGNHKLYLFRRVETAIKEKEVLELSSLKLSVIDLASSPIYISQNGRKRYGGICLPYKSGDWITFFSLSGDAFSKNMKLLREDVMKLSSSSFRIGYMACYKSYFDHKTKKLSYQVVDEVRRSNSPSEKIKKSNLARLDEYTLDILYNSMSEYGMEREDVLEYIYGSDGLTSRVINATEGEDISASKVLCREIRRCRNARITRGRNY